MSSDANTVDANPSKAFFIDMITRDLGITDCILDLLDNSVDHAVERAACDVMLTLTNGGPPSLIGATVEIEFTPSQFTIRDTCGGISIEAAKKHVFLFGNPSERGAVNGLSVYGIGMKRAFFKLGRTIRIESATDREWFEMDIDVDQWRTREKDWTFEFARTGQLEKNDTTHRPSSTTIRITRLREEVQARFSQTSFVRELSERLASTYSLFLKSGLSILMAGEPIASSLPQIARTEGTIAPARKVLRQDGVDVLILAGISPRNDRAPRGWYVFCNGRLVLDADKSSRTGWGDELPQWHTKFNHFVGYVYFKSGDVRSLPWTTTKQDIVVDSPVYQTALREMQVQGRAITAFLTNAYPTESEPEVPEREVFDKAEGVSIDTLPREEASFFAAVRDKRKGAAQLVSIQYRKPRKDIDRVRQHLRRKGMSASAVGEYTFDYFVKSEL